MFPVLWDRLETGRLSAPTHYLLQNQDPLNENACCIIRWWPPPDITHTGPSVHLFAFAGTVCIDEAWVHQQCILGTSKVYVLGRYIMEFTFNYIECTWASCTHTCNCNLSTGNESISRKSHLDFHAMQKQLDKYNSLSNGLIRFILLLWSEICGKINNCQIAFCTEEQEKAFSLVPRDFCPTFF